MSSPELEAQVLRNRLSAGNLLDAVLDERMEARQAIVRWPEAGECPDSSLEVAYQALWHFESDEDRQRGELFYMDAQFELLSQMARYLQAGKPLPPYMLKAYSPDYRVRFFYGQDFGRDLWQEVRGLAERFFRLWRTALGLGAASLPKHKPLRRKSRGVC